MNNNQFLPIPGYESLYQMSVEGIVQTSRKHAGRKFIVTDHWTTLKLRHNPDGYLVVVLTDKNGKRRTRLIHRLILEMFGPSKPFATALALHKDDNPINNGLDNLYWGTSKDNRADAMRSGKAFIGKGESNGHARLTVRDIIEIRSFPRKYGYRKILSKRFMVSVATIKDVISKRSWNESSGVPPIAEPADYDKLAARK